MLLNLFWNIGLLAIATTAAYASELCVRVNDELDRPLAESYINATDLITAKTYTLSADVRGRGCFKLPEGVYAVEAGHNGYLNVRYYPFRVLIARPRLETTMRLPIGEITEGGVSEDAVLSGTVTLDEQPVRSGEICILRKETHLIVTCGVTDEFGEYVLTVPPGFYDLEARTPQRQVFTSTADISTPGFHRKRIVIPSQRDVH